jgi:hypothetical protein
MSQGPNVPAGPHNPLLCLPIEVWRIIFRAATASVIHADGRSVFGEDWDSYRTYSPESGAAKDTISRVCNSWRRLLYEFLFERVSIDVVRSPLPPNRSFVVPLPDEGQHPFRCLQQLVLKSAITIRATIPTPEQIDAVIEPLGLCQNLIVYKHAMQSPCQPLLDAVFNKCGHSLRAVEVGVVLSDAEDFVHRIVATAPQIEYISEFVQNELLRRIVTIVGHPKPSYLGCDIFRSSPSNILSLPNLERLRINGSDTSHDDYLLFSTLIKTIHICSYFPDSYVVSLQLIFDRFSLLGVVSLPTSRAEGYWNVHGCFPRLRQVGIICEVVYDPTDCLGVLKTFTNRDVFPSFPHLCLRDFDDSKWEDAALDYEWLPKYVDLCRVLRIRLEILDFDVRSLLIGQGEIWTVYCNAFCCNCKFRLYAIWILGQFGNIERIYMRHSMSFQKYPILIAS